MAASETSIPTDMPFIYNTMPCYPGAYLLNTSGGAHPIFCSIANFSTWEFSNVDNYYIIMPGYKISVYSKTNYETTNNTYYSLVNTGNVVKYFSVVTENRTENDAESCKLYFNGAEIAVLGIS